jgi:DHA3 family macrolide efflux protein-like MFS transporter
VTAPGRDPAAATTPCQAAPPAARMLNRNFLLLWQGQAISELGNAAFSVAIAYWLLQATGSASLMGLLLASTSLTMVLLAPFGGAIADRFSRLRILVICDAGAGVAMLGLGSAMLSGRLSRPQLVALVFGLTAAASVFNAFFQPALAASIPDLVPAAKLIRANSLNQFSLRAAALLGLSCGGMLYGWLGAPRIFLLDGITFLFCAGSEALVRLPPRAARAPLGLAAGARQFVAELGEGVAYVLRTPGPLAYITFPAAHNFFTSALFVLLPFFVRNNLHAGASWYGLLLAAISCGAIAGFLIAGLVRFTGRARMRFMTALIAVAPVPMLVTGFIHRTAVALAVALLLGMTIGMINVNTMTLLQSSTPAELRGRVMGLWTALVAGLAPLGMALGGIAGDLTGKNLPLIFSTCGALALAINLCTISRRATRQFLARA